MRDLNWSSAEKLLARRAFDRALKPELQELIREAKRDGSEGRGSIRVPEGGAEASSCRIAGCGFHDPEALGTHGKPDLHIGCDRIWETLFTQSG